MPKSLTQHLEVDKEDFDDTGAFDPILDLDTQLFIDPVLLRTTTVPELANSHERLRNHFSKIIQVLAQSKKKRDRLWRAAADMLGREHLRRLRHERNARQRHGQGHPGQAHRNGP